MNAILNKLRLPAQALAQPVVEEGGSTLLEGTLLAADTKQEGVEDLMDGGIIVVNASSPALTEETPILTEEKAPLALMDFPTYKAKRLRKCILSSGEIVLPENGIFTARTEEAYDLLNHYARLDQDWVEPLF